MRSRLNRQAREQKLVDVRHALLVLRREAAARVEPTVIAPLHASDTEICSPTASAASWSTLRHASPTSAAQHLW